MVYAGADYSMNNAILLKEFGVGVELTTPVSLSCFHFRVKCTSAMFLKLRKAERASDLDFVKKIQVKHECASTNVM